MPEITIDGKKYEYEGEHKLLQFCMDNGIEVPFFCYHPAMSSPTNCRMCLVEVGFEMRDRATGNTVLEEDGSPKIQWGRKPATSCNQALAPGMIVMTQHSSPEVKKMQEGVLEYMLVNHPLDCPICDQAGECPLQIWTYKYGPEGSRFESEKGHKPKRIELGPNVVLDAERCINCTRCTRFTEEISKSDQLSIMGRGDKNYPACAPGQPFNDPYSMNTVDLCPVGALTSKSFRFNARVWEMAHTPSIDMCDSTGTNTHVWIRDNKVMRITPRENLKINDYWMPDAHRLDIDKYNENRVSGGGINNAECEIQDAVDKAAELLKEAKSVFFLGSAYASMESNYALRELAKKVGKSEVYYIPNVVKGFGDNWLVQDDRTPNAAACELLGFKAIEAADLKAKLAGGDINTLYALENDLFFSGLSKELESVTAIIHAYQHQFAFANANVLLPAANCLESVGTYINKDNIPQVSNLAKEIKQMSPEMWMRLNKSRLDKAAVAVDNWRDLKNVFDVLPGWKMIKQVSDGLGQGFTFNEHKDVFGKLKAEFDVLREVKIDYKVPIEAFKITQYDFAIN